MSALSLFPGYTQHTQHAHSLEFLGFGFRETLAEVGSGRRGEHQYGRVIQVRFCWKGVCIYFLVIYILQLNTEESRRQSQAAVNHV